jgi:phosphomannomutase
LNIIFGTDGWRALLDSEINDYTISIAADAFARYILKQSKSPSVAIAYDNRRNSLLFANIMGEVFSANNIYVHLADNITPTPVLSWYVKEKRISYGVMITASHNPPEYNGVKFKASYGGPFLTEETAEVEKLLIIHTPKRNSINISKVNMIESYSRYIENSFDFDKIRKAGLNLLVDSMGGAGGSIIENILTKNGIDSTTIYSPPSENFYNRLAEPIESNLKPLSEFLRNSTSFSFAAATDGDADRVGIMDDNGEWVSAQETIMLLADYLIHKKGLKGGLVKTSSVTGKLDSFSPNVTAIHEVQVGFKYICEMMLKEKIILGVEESGGFGYGSHIPERDGIYSTFLLLSLLAESGYNKLTDYLDLFRKKYGEIHYNRIDFHYAGENRNKILPQLFNNLPAMIGKYPISAALPFYSSRRIINGIKFLTDDPCRWLLLRSSETEPLIRIYAEGLSENESLDLIEQGKKFFYE